MFEFIEYDRTTANRCRNLADVLSPQETADLLGQPVKDGDTIYYPNETKEVTQ